MAEKKKFILIDAYALIHRAYHALPPLTTKSGELINAVFGFSSILIKVLQKIRPDYVAAAFDAPEPTFRHEEYKGYKATRPEAPPDLYIQVPRVKEVLEALKIPVYEKSGYEADDIIGTIAKKLRGKNIEVLILTGDMDTLQLVGGNVKVYTPKRGLSDEVIYDERKIAERFEGLKPEQMVDFKGLKGDPSDNIPGVRGIGEKTAITLLNKFGTIEKLYGAIAGGKTEGISPSVLEKLEIGKDAAYFSKKLSTLKLNVPLKFSLKENKFGEFNKEKPIELFRNLGFISLINRLPASWRGKSGGQEQGTLAMPPSISIKGRIGYDFKSFIKTPAGKKMITSSGDFDVMIAAYVLNPGERDYSLEKLSLREFGAVLPKAEAVSRLAPIFKNRLIETETEKVFREIEMPLIPVLAKMEFLGIKVDGKKLKDLKGKIEKELSGLEKEIYKLAGEKFNINSPQQLAEILFIKLKIPGTRAGGRIKKTPGGAPSTEASELEKLRPRHKIIDYILKYRELAKLKSTYTDSLIELIDEKGRIHTIFNQTGTASGRLSSQDPNLQNIPARGTWGDEIRKSFIAEKGFKMVSIDYSQIHLRIIAALANDEKMMDAFKKGLDIHKFTAAEINNVSIGKVTKEMRFAAKALNFGIIYGIGAQSFAESAGISREKAQRFMDEYLKDFSGVARYIEKLKAEARKRGFTTTFFGRRRYLPEIHSPNPMLRSQAERIAINMPIQGLEADIMKKAMIEIDDWIKSENLSNSVKMLLQVHDELLFEVKKDFVKEATVKIIEIMENVIKLKVPIVAEAKIGDNWGELRAFSAIDR
jgi:DNA polymerase-1